MRTTAWMQEVEQCMEPLPRFATQKLDILGTRYEFHDLIRGSLNKSFVGSTVVGLARLKLNLRWL